MLKNLTIKNIALIANLTVDFGENLCVLTGETGAGKSIIVDSLAFVIGGKADKNLIKSGEEKAIVEAVFEVEETSLPYLLLKELGYEPDTTIVLFRAMNLQGKNECRLNGRICALSVLKTIANTLVDIFGQSEHVNFLRKEAHLEIIDKFKKSNLIAELENVVAEYKQQRAELNRFGGTDEERARALSLIEYEINEIKNANLSCDEEEKLLSLKAKVANVEKIAGALKNSLSHLTETTNIASEIWLASTSLQSVLHYDKDIEDCFNRLQNVKYEIDDLIGVLDAKLSECDYNPVEIDNIITRIDDIKRLKRKYGATIEDVLNYLAESEQKYTDLIESTTKIEIINKKLTKLKDEAYRLSEKLSCFRQKSSEEFCRQIQQELTDLGMKDATFSTYFAPPPDFEEFIPSEKGYDNPEFMFSANKGEPEKQLSKVISGGEMSRFLLAVKNVTARIENISTMIFDEIDVGLSGNIAQMVSKKLANISRQYQCIVITHLPQVASMGDSNYLIEKSVREDKTYTSVVLADYQLKIKEVERLMGGENIGEYSKKHAEEMIAWAENYKNKTN